MYARLAGELYEMGWPTIPVAGKRPIVPDWQVYGEYMPDWQQIFVNARKFPAENMGLPLGRSTGVVALDLDIDDFDIAADVRSLTEATLGQTIIRHGRPPRVVMLYQSDMKTKRMGKVELLGEGAQVVIYGRHPGGFWYSWEDESPLDTYPGDLPRLLESNWEGFVEDLHDILPPTTKVLHDAQQLGAPFDASDLRGARHGFGATWYRSVAAQLSAAQPGCLHHTMVSAVAAMVNKGLDDEHITNFLKVHFNAPSSGSYAEVWDQIDGAIAGARSKWK